MPNCGHGIVIEIDRNHVECSNCGFVRHKHNGDNMSIKELMELVGGTTMPFSEPLDASKFTWKVTSGDITPDSNVSRDLGYGTDVSWTLNSTV